MFVPSVRENSTGVRVRKEDLRRDWSAGMSRLARWPVRYRGGFEMRRVQARQGGGVAGWATRVGVLCLWCYSNIRDGGTRLVWISLRSPPRPLFWADEGVGEESGAGDAGIGRNCSRVFACKRTDQGRLP
jgi:hypothetical protein